MSTCHVCGASEPQRVFPERAGELVLNRCGACGFVYLASWEQSLADADSLYDYYAKLSDEDVERRHSDVNRARQRSLLEGLAQLTEGRTLLDVGCGDGQLLDTARDEGWQPRGIDLCEPAIEICRRRSLPASTTDFFDTSLDGARFDVIVMSELIEHVPAPQRFLERAEALLEPGGALYVTTPNYGSLARRLLGPEWPMIHREHIGYFEPSSLEGMLRGNTALQSLRIDTNNLSPAALMRWMRGAAGRSQGAETASDDEAPTPSTDQRLRRLLHAYPRLGAGKDALNRLVSRTGLGDTLVAWAQKPGRP